MAKSPRLSVVIVGIALLVFGPFAVTSGLLYVEHVSSLHSQLFELAILAVGVGTGVVGVWLLPAGRLLRGVMIALYVVVMAAATWFSMLPLVCAYFGDCL